jgi:hypothetical protein
VPDRAVHANAAELGKLKLQSPDLLVDPLPRASPE